MDQMVSGLESLQFQVVRVSAFFSLHIQSRQYTDDSMRKEAKKTHFVGEIEKDVIHAFLLFQHLKVTVQRAVWINSARIKKTQQ